MARGPRITPEERERILALAPQHGIRGTAAIIQRAPHAVRDVCLQGGVDIHAFAQQRGAEAMALLGRERRLGLLAGIADHVEAQLAGAEPMIAPKDLRDLSVSLGVAIDKQRLEEGLSSFNAETHIRSWTVKQPPTPES